MQLKIGVAAIAGLMVACSPSTKGETETYERAQKNITELSGKWPAFKKFLDEDQAAVKKQWDAALKETDEDKKAEMMKKANESRGKLLGKVSQVKSKAQGIRDLIKKINKLKLPKDKSRRRATATSEAYEAITAAENAMASAELADKAAANELAQTQVSALISARGDLDRVYRSVKPKKAKKKKRKKRRKL